MPSIKIVEVVRVVAPATAALSPAPLLLCLSALDAPWLAFPLLQRVFIFEDDAPAPFASRVASLRASLAATLSRFPPLAGRIVFLPDTGDAAIDCSDRGLAGGVRFVVAEADDADAGRLSSEDAADHDVETFRRLVPLLDSGVLPAEALAVQVTRLRRGGVALGVALHHAVVDGRSLWSFVEAWAAACRGDDTADTTLPSFDRTAVALPGGRDLARSTLRKYMPDLPILPQSPVDGPIFPRRTFTVTERQMNRLKQRIADQTRWAASSGDKPSSFVAVAALSWASYVRSKHPAAISGDHDVYVFFFVDCRGRRGFDPPVSQSFFGSCVTGCLAKATARDLLAAADGVAAAAAAVQKEVRRAAEDPLALWDWMSLVSSSLPLDRVLNMSGSPRFRAYEAADFGWGAPSRTELVSMENPGQVVLVAGKGGGVQASAVMHPDHMDTFSSQFVAFLDY